MKGFLIAVGMLMLFGLVESLDKTDSSPSASLAMNPGLTETATR